MMSLKPLLKIIGVLLFAAPLNQGVCFAQGEVVRLAAGNVLVEDVIRETEKQTRYLFVYGNNTFDTERQVVISDEENKLSDLLQMVAGDKWKYEIRSRYIVISEAPKPKVEVPEVYQAPPAVEEEIVPEKGTEFPTLVSPPGKKKKNVRPVVTPGI